MDVREQRSTWNVVYTTIGHDYTNVGGRAKQEARAEESEAAAFSIPVVQEPTTGVLPAWNVSGFLFLTNAKRLHPCRQCCEVHDGMDAGGRTTQETKSRMYESDFEEPIKCENPDFFSGDLSDDLDLQYLAERNI